MQEFQFRVKYMAIIRYYDDLGRGGYLRAGNYYSSSTSLSSDGNLEYEIYDSDTVMFAETANDGAYGVVYFIDYIGSDSIYELDSLYLFDDNVNSLISMYDINIQFNIYDDFSSGGYFSNILSSNDSIYGNRYADNLSAGRGNDAVYGYAGNDTLTGGAGKDKIAGGAGSDRFIFESSSESSTGATSADVITDFTTGSDRINLSAIDAFDPSSANDTFVWKGTSSFSSTSKGEVRYEKFNNSGTSNDYTMVWIDTDRDSDVEMAVRLTGLHSLTESDFIL
jgi:Ca2+-binding RTX toxin-like protein